MRKAEIELEILSSKSKENPSYIFHRLYRLLFNKDIFMVAYVKLSSHEGNMTAGTDGRTIDGFSEELVDELIKELRTERYYPEAVRRTYIPKKDGRQRPLGIPSFRDKLVQEVIRTILEAIYEPTFLESSHGYRPKRSCHTSLCHVKRGMGTSWVIEGDIKGFFDNIDHEILLKLLSKRIDDGRFIELVRRSLKAGYIEFKEIHNSLSGTPQGGIISPILANIYLHELDSYMETLKAKHEKGNKRESNPEYDVLYRKRRKEIREGKIKEAEEILRKMRKLPSQYLMDENFVRMRYVRYADDFLIMIIGNKKLAKEIREEVREFLIDKLKLELSMDKTKITNLSEERVKFLGYEITRTKENTKVVRNINGIRKRAINGTIQLLMPTVVIREHLKDFTKAGKPIHHNARINDPILDIVNTYNTEIRGLYNYYCLATDVSRKIGRFKYYHYGSLLKTIARKEKRTVGQVIERYGMEVKRKDGKGTRKIIGVKYETKEGTKIMVYFNDSLKTHKQPMNNIDRLIIPTKPRSQLEKRLNAKQCEYCGENDRIVVHHVRKLKDVIKKYTKRGNITPKWVLLMAGLRRKTLVLCQDCHTKLHQGTLDGKTAIC